MTQLLTPERLEEILEDCNLGYFHGQGGEYVIEDLLSHITALTEERNRLDERVEKLRGALKLADEELQDRNNLGMKEGLALYKKTMNAVSKVLAADDELTKKGVMDE